MGSIFLFCGERAIILDCDLSPDSARVLPVVFPSVAEYPFLAREIPPPLGIEKERYLGPSSSLFLISISPPGRIPSNDIDVIFFYSQAQVPSRPEDSSTFLDRRFLKPLDSLRTFISTPQAMPFPPQLGSP